MACGEVEADALHDRTTVVQARFGLGEADDLEVVALDRELLRDDRGATGRKCGQELDLRADHSLDRPDELEMHRADVGDDADVGPGDRAELRDLAEAAHGQLDDADLGVGLEPAEGEREADLVVEARLRGDGRSGRGAERRKDVLGRGLARRAGDADDPGSRTVTHRRTQRPQGGKGLVGDERRGRPARPRILEKLRPAADGHEQVSRRHPA